ncbi:hypothetical protein KY338_02440 [Candidatus Woesearchaeota archaeon]|nr:hypothetical protein [Candidatus Woesearchaeota archaeon]MBW3005925.1 hypothetical protein [Candidatus Woesearchaeota archaeon]
MKITIDTSQDSHSEIRKAIRMLQSIVGEGSVYSNSPSRNIFDDPSPTLGSEPEPSSASEETTGSAFASIFDNPAPGSEEDKEETPEKRPQIELY